MTEFLYENDVQGFLHPHIVLVFIDLHVSFLPHLPLLQSTVNRYPQKKER